MKKHIKKLVNSTTQILMSKGFVVYTNWIGFNEPEVVANVVNINHIK